MPNNYHRFLIVTPLAKTEQGIYVAQIIEATDSARLAPEQKLYQSELSAEDAEQQATSSLDLRFPSGTFQRKEFRLQ